MITLSKLKI